MKKCQVCGCNNEQLAKGYCSKHYMQVRRHGQISERTMFDPNDIIEYGDYAEIIIYDKNCKEVARALIDLEDVDKVKDMKWYTSHGYVLNKQNKQRLHRFIMNCPDGMVIDHINHNRLDNRKSNLRICTQHQNNMNQGIRNNNTSGIIGVSFDRQKNKWMAYITYNGRKIHLGSFNTKEEAIQARKNAEIEYFGEYRNDSEDVN
jgi:hypothetical protein